LTRNSRFQPTNTQSTSSPTVHDETASSTASVPYTASPSVANNALPPHDPPAPPVRVSPEEQVMSDLLALTVSSNPSPSSYTPVTPEPGRLNQSSAPTGELPRAYHGDQGHVSAPYVAPWAQPQSQTAGSQQPTRTQAQVSYSSYAYPPPPWASQDSTESNPFVAAASSSQQYQSTSRTPTMPPNLRPLLQQSHSFGVPLPTASLDSPINGNLKQPLSAGARRPSYVSSNKFFDDLFERNSDGSLKVGSTRHSDVYGK
jgi:hypothetical protein